MKNAILIAFALITFMVTSSRTEAEIQNNSRDYLRPQLVAITVSDLDRSINWYIEKLGFRLEGDIKEYPDYNLRIAFLELNGFRLEIIEFDTYYGLKDLKPDKADYNIGGLLKIGFKVKDINSMYNRLRSFEDVDFITDVQELPESDLDLDWPNKHFLIRDPDNNLVQFFDKSQIDNLSPWLFLVTVSDLDESISWYSKNLNFKYHTTVGTEGNKRAILEHSGNILELFEPSNVIKPNELPQDSMTIGFKKLAFGVDDLRQLSHNFKDATIKSPLSKSDVDWAENVMIILDREGNWIQLFETIN